MNNKIKLIKQQESSNRKQISKILKSLREDAGLTQGEAAYQIGKVQSYISKIELGTRKVTFEEVLTLLKLYKASISVLSDYNWSFNDTKEKVICDYL